MVEDNIYEQQTHCMRLSGKMNFTPFFTRRPNQESDGTFLTLSRHTTVRAYVVCMTQDTYEPQYLGKILYSSDRLLEGQGMQILVGKADSKVCIAKVKT